ncbi:hypothetical protein LOK49_LG09G00420 [Camellia lanceoleosa]|uniref:Uncharacterized protein n=1 Tax=Camellia lanceoleosa TaxID=1840588 RepID=A0ACC0GG73_9ERIC|nr:hypothetical protein LOK49_LG09G00420 [Camellia lanceoleosa]
MIWIEEGRIWIWISIRRWCLHLFSSMSENRVCVTLDRSTSPTLTIIDQSISRLKQIEALPHRLDRSGSSIADDFGVNIRLRLLRHSCSSPMASVRSPLVSSASHH